MERPPPDASTTMETAVPSVLAIAVSALEQIATAGCDRCPGCRWIRDALRTPGKAVDARVEVVHEERCAGAVAWTAIARIAGRLAPPPPSARAR